MKQKAEVRLMVELHPADELKRLLGLISFLMILSELINDSCGPGSNQPYGAQVLLAWKLRLIWTLVST